MLLVGSILRAARPHQWIKNLFVAAPLVFAQRMDDTASLLRTLAAVGCFCVLSSAVYLLNDIVDVEKDRAHPVKRNRPIASGALPVPLARLLTVAFAALALGGAALLSARFLAVAAGYFSLNLAYSWSWKRVAYLDVTCIAAGFLLRVLGGAYAIPVPPSPWLLACTGLLAAMLGFGKRAHELRVAGARGLQRDVLERYHPGSLRILLRALAGATLLTYSAYTQSPHARHIFGTRFLAVTIPFVAFGIFRFAWLAARKSDPESPTDSMLRDRWFLGNLVLYAIAIVAVIYVRK